MTKLKTLKDLGMAAVPNKFLGKVGIGLTWMIKQEELKQEAIKDIKEIIKCPKIISTNFKKDGELEIEAIIPTKDFDFWKDKVKSAEGNADAVKIKIEGEEALRIVELNDFIGAEEYIIWKNNITEEDLK